MLLHKRRLVAALLLPLTVMVSAWRCSPGDVQYWAYQTQGIVLTPEQSTEIANKIPDRPAFCEDAVVPNNCSIAYYMALNKGYSDADFVCLDYIIMHESGWANVPNAAGGRAYGIPQALPGSKMATHGSDWHDNPITQIHWLLDYVEGRYGSPCSAKVWKIAHGWY